MMASEGEEGRSSEFAGAEHATSYRVSGQQRVAGPTAFRRDAEKDIYLLDAPERELSAL